MSILMPIPMPVPMTPVARARPPRPSRQRTWWRAAALLLVAVGLPLRTTAGQRATESARPLATRVEIAAEVARLRALPTPDGTQRSRLKRLDDRLALGDLRAGDLVLLHVPGEVALSDTFTVEPDGALRLPSPTVGTLPLAGVLHVELEPLVRAYVGRFVDASGVRVRPLVRVALEGEVSRAGYYAVPVDAPLADVVMAANGLTREADLRRVRIVRQGRAILDHEEVRTALASGWTAADVPLRAGDSIEIGRGRGTTEGRLRFTWLLVSLAGGIYGLTRAF